VVDCTGLENRQRATFREFESHRLRQDLHITNYFLCVFKKRIWTTPSYTPNAAKVLIARATARMGNKKTRADRSGGFFVKQ
jgi:hypothetical protein